MMRLWTRSLAARFICFTFLSLMLSQSVVFFISWDEHGQVMRKAAKAETLSRCASLARVLEATPAALHKDILAASSTSTTRYWISPDRPKNSTAWRQQAWSYLGQPLPPLAPPGNEVNTAVPTEAGVGAAPRLDVLNSSWIDLPPHAWPLSRPAKFVYLDDDGAMGITVQLADGSWLNSAFAKRAQENFWTSQSTVSLALSALVLSVIAVITARGIAQPMRRLVAAAEALGRGEKIAPLPETGPDDIRRTAEAFNRMQSRLVRFIDDRTRMLAAIGHDLRTPLTSLRLRAEFVSDDELREKMLSTIAEIQSMTEATLTFVREEATAETTRTVDLPALVESMCDDLAELGYTVTFAEGQRISYRCRPDALRRACRNLVENAVRYGERARVSVTQGPENIEIVVEDDGPGIPDVAREQVFAPFFRMEHSRNRETGGLGLGLSIARTIVRRHGGDIVLFNQPGGLRASISLPKSTGELPLHEVTLLAGEAHDARLGAPPRGMPI
ncbi:MAG: two-component sensor histidine kinase [Rhizobiales bacterium 24-66-13]|jgi:signal transduction histidine kinase|uniref:sensor histidine kinase n=1 Tax=Roseixanthobacter finlandensis TaxID=3119922 RepID=UPI000BD07019|nr:MAG: two-component sensor histidine kinase [Rhizobiales bacterium 24-66-13]OZB05423.1 MAG: two-component sensor histidine kinase [Rhizobiales bacterium 39-66-18]HQS10370.1 ATP-binding protein [Xanthobacteraceae bacterium]HQS48446.1 ATP-binding protein [Xanthobacteraceae bacterium]